jgi:solute:Na+ symporter, SSS family
MSQKLDTVSLAVLLVCANYGLGFILGTAENTLTQGIAGSLYAVSTGFGLLILSGLAKFYWCEEQPIWTLLDRQYGGNLKIVISLMSWSWMVGVVAAQILGGAFIFKCLGMPLQLGMLLVACLFMILSLTSVNKVSKIFKTLLAINSVVIVYSLFKLDGVSNYIQAPFSFVSDLSQLPIGQIAGTVLTTLLLIPIGMQFQVFIVQARAVNVAIQGCILGGIALLFLAFVPSAVALSAIESGVLPAEITGKEIIPFIFSWLAGGIHEPFGILLMLSLLGSALGSGSGLLRAMNQTIGQFDRLSSSKIPIIFIAAINTVIALVISLIGGSIISLMVSFYALYVSAVLVPFLAYLLEVKKQIQFTSTSIQLSTIGGGFAAIAVLILTFAAPNLILWESQQLSIIVVGVSASILGLLVGQGLEKFSLNIKANPSSS